MAGNPEQVSVKNLGAVIDPVTFQKLKIRPGDEIFRCSYCDAMYVSVGIPGFERIIGKLTPTGFVASR